MRINHMKKGLQELVSDLPVLKTMVEIGSYAGESTEIFAKSGKFHLIYAVDPWENGYDSQSKASELVPMQDVEKRFDQVKERYPIICKLKTTSKKAASFCPSVDLVYIDGDHRYPAVVQDILLWRSKTRFLCLHDYQTNHPGVFQAVNELLGKPLKVYPDHSCLFEIWQ